MKRKLKILLIIICVIFARILIDITLYHVDRIGWSVLTVSQEKALKSGVLDLTYENLERLGYTIKDEETIIHCFASYSSVFDNTKICEIYFDTPNDMRKYNCEDMSIEISQSSEKIRIKHDHGYFKRLLIEGDGFEIRIVLFSSDKDEYDAWYALSYLLVGESVW